MLQVNVVALTELTHTFAKPMVARGQGHILLVASMAAYGPTPVLAGYGATKAYVLAFGEALHVELSPKVGVTVLSSGLMETVFFDVSVYQPPAALRRTMLPAAEVARIGLDAMWAGKPTVIAGRLNRLMRFASRFTSRQASAKMLLRMAEG
jgi:short-subunit dehydrogenase